jgi:pimeloyl-ACP methyl ester carboxylesterase
MAFLALADQRIEYEAIGAVGAAPPLVFLHEGLGSVAMWRDFPAALARATHCPAIVYSRPGYGRSLPRRAPLGADYMHREALETLPALRAALGLGEPILIGHSDGGSIALIHAGVGSWPVRALVLEAPHVFVEETSLASIAAAETAFATGDLKPRLARYHDDPETAFRGWNDAWLSPEFRRWNIEEYVAGIRCPVLLIQGEDDPYGTLAQLDAIERRLSAPCERLVLPHCGHSPHRDQRAATLAAMATFIARVAT